METTTATAELARPPHPTEPEVGRLMQLTAEHAEGDIVAYSMVEPIAGPRGSDRFGTVVAAWKRRALRDANVCLRAVPNVGYMILPAGARVDYGSDLSDAAARRVRLSLRIVSTTEVAGLDPVQIAHRDHHMKTAGGMLAVYAAGTKRMASAVSVLRLRKSE